jgi:hypothetical protein
MNTSIFLFSIITSSFVLVGYIALEYKKTKVSSNTTQENFSEIEAKMKEINNLDLIKKNKKIQQVAVKTDLFQKVYAAKKLEEQNNKKKQIEVEKPIVEIQQPVVKKQEVVIKKQQEVKTPVVEKPSEKQRFNDAAERIKKRLLEAA